MFAVNWICQMPDRALVSFISSTVSAVRCSLLTWDRLIMTFSSGAQCKGKVACIKFTDDGDYFRIMKML